MIKSTPIQLPVTGLGIIMYSPDAMAHVPPETDYLAENFETEEQVQAHLQRGELVGFGTGSPGRYTLHFHSGYPDEDILQGADEKLRLGVRCSGGILCVRDLFTLIHWTPTCPLEHQLSIDDGIYHVTVYSYKPLSGIIGDNQLIHVYLQPLTEFPKLAKKGIPHLFWDTED